MDPSQGLTVTALLAALGMGFASFLSPCILPLIPSYLSYITGISYDRLSNPEAPRGHRNATMLHSAAFVIGFSIIFAFLGATASMVGSILSEHLESIRIVGGVFVISMGVFVTDMVHIPFLLRETRLNLTTRPAGYAGTIVIGMIFGAGWTPCIGPFLASALTLAMETNTVGKGMALLMFYSLGLGIPFILSSLALHTFLSSFNRLKKHFRVVKVTSGVILMIMGVLLIMNKLTILIPR